MTLSLSSDLFEYAPVVLIEDVISGHQRILLFGQPGNGKTILACALAEELSARGLAVQCLSADPGSPGFGLPGAVCLGDWQDGAWSMVAFEGLCTQDAARFRLPLVSAVSTLAAEAGCGHGTRRRIAAAGAYRDGHCHPCTPVAGLKPAICSRHVLFISQKVVNIWDSQDATYLLNRMKTVATILKSEPQ